MTDRTPDPAERRTRYAAAMARRDGDTWPTTYESDEPDYLRRADAAIAVADGEITRALNAESSNAARYLFERDAERAENARLRAAAPSTPADQNLRDRIRRACAEADGARYEELEPWDYQVHADKLLAVLPARADRAAVLCETAASLLARCPALGKHDALPKCPCAAAEELRRMADEAQQQSRLTSPGRVYPDVMADCLRDDRRAMIAQFAAVLGDGNPAALRTVADRIAGQHQWIADVIRTEADRLDKKQQAGKSEALEPSPAAPKEDPTDRRETVDFFVESQLPDGEWEQASSTDSRLGFIEERLASLRQRFPDAEFRLRQRTTTIVVETLADCPQCEWGVEHDVHCPHPETHNAGCGCPDEAQHVEVVHGCPPDGSGLTPCCRRTPFELPLGDRISSEVPVTCPGAAEAQQAGEAT